MFITIRTTNGHMVCQWTHCTMYCKPGHKTKVFLMDPPHHLQSTAVVSSSLFQHIVDVNLNQTICHDPLTTYLLWAGSELSSVANRTSPDRRPSHTTTSQSTEFRSPWWERECVYNIMNWCAFRSNQLWPHRPTITEIHTNTATHHQISLQWY